MFAFLQLLLGCIAAGGMYLAASDTLHAESEPQQADRQHLVVFDVKNEFENRYRGYSSRSVKPEYKPVLVGLAEAQNAQIGFRSLKPRLIGNPEKASDVYLGGIVQQTSVIRLGDVAETLKLEAA